MLEILEKVAESDKTTNYTKEEIGRLQKWEADGAVKYVYEYPSGYYVLTERGRGLLDI